MTEKKNENFEKDLIFSITKALMNVQSAQSLVMSLNSIFKEKLGIDAVNFCMVDYATGRFKDFVRDWLYVEDQDKHIYLSNIFQQIQTSQNNFILNGRLSSFISSENEIKEMKAVLNNENNLIYFPIVTEFSAIGIIEFYFRKLNDNVKITPSFLQMLQIVLIEISTAISNYITRSGMATNLNFYDALGYSYTARMTFKQSDDPTNSKYSMEFTKLLDSNGNEVEMTDAQKKAVFGGGIPQTQERATSVKLGDNYSWSSAGDLLVNNNPLVYATGNTDYPYAMTTPAPTDEAELAQSYEEALNQIAKAYGYEGSVNEFLNLQIPVEVTGDNGTTVTKNYSIDDILHQSVDALNGITLDKALGAGKESPGRTYYGYDVEFNGDNGEIASVGGNSTTFMAKLNLADLGEGFTNFSNIDMDLSQISMYDNKGTSTVSADKGDLDGLGTGRRLGDMIGVSVQNNGMIYASYDNGMTKLLGQIASASFANASGLERAGDNLYSATLNSGEFDGIGVDVTANGGYMTTGQLEMSNVDLSAEFTEMITTQRGFQANSRIITVSDTLLEELTNLKR